MTRSSREGMAPLGEVHRLFFALWPDAPTRARIAAAAGLLQQHPHQRGRWLKPHRYHLTLHFLGEFSDSPGTLAAHACAGANQVEATAFTLTLDRAGSFRNRSIPWWLGCAKIPPEMTGLWTRLAAALHDCGVACEAKTPLTPHVTVLRDSDVTLPPIPVVPAVAWHVDEFVLIHSRMGAQAQYRLLGSWPLRSGEPAAPPKSA